MSFFSLQPELRALEVFDVVPAGHFGLLIVGDQFEPHLKAGEFAIVDATDKERVKGELYVLTIGVARPELTIVEYEYDCEVGIFYAFGFQRDIQIGDRTCRYHDGPLNFRHWPDTCHGRVVGVMERSRVLHDEPKR